MAKGQHAGGFDSHPEAPRIKIERRLRQDSILTPEIRSLTRSVETVNDVLFQKSVNGKHREGKS